MPKEVIRNASVLGDDQLCHTEVRWSRDQYVQLATVRKTEQYAVNGDVQGWFVDYDRNSLNELIRVARKARDQAFGADA